MQLTIRIDSNNFAVFNLQLQGAGNGQPEAGPELLSAVVSEQKLSNLQMDDLLGLAGQVCDFFSAERQTADQSQDDWRELFRAGKL